LGCTVVGTNLEQTGRFAHSPEPIPENLVPLHSFHSYTTYSAQHQLLLRVSYASW
jgi:hypothetical protein